MSELLNFTKCDIFTPESISKLMSSKLKKEGNLLEPSVGTGNLLNFVDFKDIDVFDIKNEYLQKINKLVTKHNTDFLLYDIEKKYDNIILNPPYIKIQELPTEYTKQLKKKFPLLQKGNIDLYHFFMLKCIQHLKEDGIMVSITPNSYLNTKSASNFRKYLFENKLIKEIIDYKEKKIFEGISVYCCITVITKENKNSLLYNDEEIFYESLTDTSNKLNLLFYKKEKKNKLSEFCKISNGIATLRDKIFIHEKKLFEENCWKEIITSTSIKWVIFPYTEDGKIICEKEFKNENPKTYDFLLTNKEELNLRDKGKKKYPEWYAYGRSQSLITSKKNKVIYVPTFVNPKNINFLITKPRLHLSCLCIEPNDENNINIIIETIKNNIEYLIKNSTPKSNGWINLSSSLLKSLTF
jgi:adenine-specific DNA-methyltransferase